MSSSKDNSRRTLAVLLSLLIHALLIYYIATVTIDYVTPEGVVTEIDFTGVEITKGDPSAMTIEPEPQPAPPPPPKPKPKPKPEPEIVKPEPPKAKEVPPPIEEGTLPVKKENIPKQLPDKDKLEEEEKVAQTTAVEEDLTRETVDDGALDAPEPLPTEAEESFEKSDLNNSGDEKTMAKNESDVPAGLPDKEPTKPTMPPPAGFIDGTPVYTEGQIAPSSYKKPSYPTQSRFFKEEGKVVFDAVIEPNGSVSKIRLIQSSGHERLDKAALESAAKTLRFRPTGEKFIYRVGTHFRLTGDPEYLENRGVEKLIKQKK